MDRAPSEGEGPADSTEQHAPYYLVPAPIGASFSEPGNSFPGGLARRAWEFIPRRSGTTGVGIHSPAVWHDGRGNSFPGGLARRAWEFIPRRSGTTGVGIHSPAVWHDGRGNSFPGGLARRAWEFIPRRSGTTGVGIHSPAVWHDGRGNSFPGACLVASTLDSAITLYLRSAKRGTWPIHDRIYK